MDQPDASYVSILKWIAGDLGMYPEELEKTFKKCREAYEKAKKRQQKVRQKRAEIERLLQKEKIWLNSRSQKKSKKFYDRVSVFMSKTDAPRKIEGGADKTRFRLSANMVDYQRS